MANNVLPDPLNVNVISPDPLPTNPVSKNYFIELVTGGIPGSIGSGKVSRSVEITDTGYLPIWGGALPMVFPVAVETWEISSSSVNDTLLGTGARKVLVNYLDFGYVEQSAIVELDGTTKVQVAIDCYRPAVMVVIDSGASKFNEGLIELQVSGGGNPRGFIMPQFAVSQDTYTTVPAGKTMILTNVSPYVGKNDSGNLKGVLEFLGTNTIVTNGVFPVYQNTFDVGLEVPFSAPEKTDFWYEFISDNVGPISVNLVIEFELRDNT